MFIRKLLFIRFYKVIFKEDNDINRITRFGKLAP